MGGSCGGGARFECTLRIAGAGDAETAWEEATEGERGLSVRGDAGAGDAEIARVEATEGERGLSVR